MIRCNKCDNLKEEKEFETYWHSTQKKMRTRKICRGCISIQKKAYKDLLKQRKITQPVVPELQPEPIIDYSLDPNYKQCIKCKEYRTKDNYYKLGTDSRFNTCKICIKIKDDEDREQELIENGGSLKIPPKPNVYRDKYQKELVFSFLPLCGWKFNEETGIWYKDGIKDENGKFLNLKESITRRNLTQSEIRSIYRLRRQGMLQREIAQELGITTATVHKWLKRNEEAK